MLPDILLSVLLFAAAGDKPPTSNRFTQTAAPALTQKAKTSDADDEARLIDELVKQVVSGTRPAKAGKPAPTTQPLAVKPKPATVEARLTGTTQPTTQRVVDRTLRQETLRPERNALRKRMDKGTLPIAGQNHLRIQSTQPVARTPRQIAAASPLAARPVPPTTQPAAHKLMKDEGEYIRLGQRILQSTDSKAVIKTSPTTQQTLDMLDQLPELSRFRGRVEIVPTGPETVTIQGDAEAVAALEGLIKALDESEVPVKLEVFQLKNARASQLAPVLNNLLTQAFRQAGRRPRPTDDVIVLSDARSNALLIGAVEERMVEIREIVEKLDSQPLIGPVTFKTFALQNVTANEAAAMLEKMIQRLQAQRGIPGEAITVIPDDRTNTLIVTAPEADLKQFDDMIKMLDVKPEFATAKMLHIPLTNASATALAQVINEMVNQKFSSKQGQALSEQIRRLKIKSKGDKELPELDLEKPIKVSAEPGTNSLLISSTEGNLKAMEEIVKLLDSVPTGEAVLVRIFPLKDGDATDIGKTLEQIFREGKLLPTGPGGKPIGTGTPVPNSVTGKAMVYNVGISADARTNILVVSGREEQLALAQEIVSYLDTPGVSCKWPAKLHKLEYADAQSMATQLQQMMTQRLQALQRLGTTTVDRERVLVLADLRSNSLIIMAKEDNYQEIVDLAKKLDTSRSIVGDIRLVPLDKTQANVIAPKIEQIWKQRIQMLSQGTTHRDMPVIETDERSNSLIIASSKDDFEAIKGLIKTLEDAPLAPIADIRIIKLENNEASVLAPVLQSLFKERMQMRQTPGARAIPSDQVAIYPDPVMNGLLVASSKENFETLTELIKKLDIEPLVDGTVRFFPLKFADATRVSEMLQKMFKEGLYKPGLSSSGQGGAAARSRDKVVLETDLRSNSLIVSASKENFSIIEKILQQVDVKDAPFLEGNVGIFKVKHADVVKLASMLQDVLKGAQQFRQRVGPEMPVTVISDDRSNTLIVSGSRDVLTQAESLVAKLDQPSDEPTREIKPYALIHASAAKAADILTDLFQEKRRGGTGGAQAAQGTAPFVRADETANVLIVAASQEDHKVVKSLIEHIDKKSEASQRMKIFPLEKAQAQDIQQVIQELYQQQRSTAGGTSSGRGAGPGISLSVDPSTNTLIVWAAPSEMEDISELVKQLDTANPREETRIRIFRLKQANSEDLAKVLNDILSGKGATRSSGRGSSSDSVLISYAQKNKETGEDAIKKLVRRNVQIVSEKVTNSLIVRASPDSLDMLEQLITSIDGIPPREVDTRVFHLVNADADQMVKVLEKLFKVGDQARRRSGGTGEEEQTVVTMAGAGLAAGLGGEGSPAGRQLLSFTPDTRTNSVIAAGTQEYLDIAEKLVRQLDEQEIEDRSNTVYRVKFSKADDLEKALKNHFKNISQLYKELGNEEAKLRQIEREVSVVADTKTNSLLVSASPRYEPQVMKMIAELDTPPPQVMIQVLMAEVTLDDSVEMGLEFAVQDLLYSETVVADPTRNGMPQSSKYDYVTGTDVGAAGAAGSLGGFTFTITGEDFNFLLRALQSEGRLEVLSRPSILAQDNEKAKISVGQQVPFVQNTNVYAGQTQTAVGYQDVGIILNVTPHINPDGFVNLEVSPEISSISESKVQITEGLNAPVFNKRQAETSVTIKDGETVVIGGLITTKEEQRENKVPILGDIPGLGLLFRATKHTKEKTELLVVLTPVVVRNEREAKDLSVKERDKIDLLPDEIRRSPLMEKLQEKPEEEPLAPRSKEKSQSRAEHGTEAKPLRTDYGPAKPQYGPAKPELISQSREPEPPIQKMVGPDSYEYYLQQRR